MDTLQCIFFIILSYVWILLFSLWILLFGLGKKWRWVCSPGEGALPYVGRYHLLVLWPPFLQISHQLTPFSTTVRTQRPHISLQSTPNDPFFQNFNFFCALSAHFNFSSDFQLKKANFHSNLTEFIPNDSLGGLHLKRFFFLNPTPNDPPKPNDPCFRSPVGI